MIQVRYIEGSWEVTEDGDTSYFSDPYAIENIHRHYRNVDELMDEVEDERDRDLLAATALRCHSDELLEKWGRDPLAESFLKLVKQSRELTGEQSSQYLVVSLERSQDRNNRNPNLAILAGSQACSNMPVAYGSLWQVPCQSCSQGGGGHR